jgi:TolA-binding protein
MRTLPRVGLGLLVLIAFCRGGPSPSRAQEKNEAATPEYNSAVKLQNKGEYKLAAEQWTEFIHKYPADARVDRAFHYLGVCYLQSNQVETALQCFETVVKHYPKCELLEATYLHLGVAQFKLGQAGKGEMYDAAAATFETLLQKYPQGPYVAQALLNRGDSLYHRDKKREAVALYARLVEKFPDDKLLADALYALGVTQEELNQPEEAGKAYDAFLKKFAENPLAAEVIMRRGETLFSAGQYQAAADWFAAAAARDGFTLADHATVRQAAALARLKNYADAAALYAALPGKYPQSRYAATANLLAGKCYYLAGKYAEARKELGKVLAGGGDSAAEAAHWMARSLLKESKPAEAAAIVDKALSTAAKGPQEPQLLMDRADAVYDLPERCKEAPALYAAVAESFPHDAVAQQALYMAGFAALGQGDYQAALKHARAFLAAYPDHELTADVTHVAAESSIQLGQFDEAGKLFEQLLQKYPQHADAEAWKVRRGLSLFLQKKYAETIAVLQPLLAGIHAPDALAEAHYLVGSSQAEQGQLAEAARSLEASLAAQPAWRQADDTLLALANVEQRLNKLEPARAHLGKLIADFPQSPLLDRAHYRLGECAALAGDLKTAVAEYRLVVEKWPQSPLLPHALYGLGWALLGQNDFAAAEQTLTTLLEKQPDAKLVPRARYGRGTARQQLGKFAPAIEDLEAMLAADAAAAGVTPAERSDARYVLGLCQAGLKKPAEAARAFQTLLKDDPQYAAADKVLYELAWALKSQDKEKEAADAFTQLTRQHADSPLAAEGQYHLGEFAYKAGDFRNAAVAYHEALEKAGQTELGEKAAHKLAWAYYRTDDTDNALKTFQYQAATWPAGPLAADAGFMVAECLFKEKKFAEALAAYGQVKDPSAKDFQVLTLLHAGQAAGQLKQWDKSLAWLAKCVKQFPDSSYVPEALYEQASAQQNLGKLDVAIALYEQVVAKTSREVAARAQFMIGEIQFQQKDHRAAVKSFFKVSYGYGYPQWQADATYEAGRCFEVLQNTTQAVKQYQELIEKFPQSDKAPLAKKRVKELQR